ncbi:zinc finger protein 2-like isoform X2 [Varroa jacobsoni]|uniref:zinc finger protein 2-like isoform X2 n=1 Tax=Varroa jacobsoni TaxID=62625 RepID=UPI000BF5FEFD|nr:zinc finger protein 2-like isoform X2 [Varroa jacobsoni]
MSEQMSRFSLVMRKVMKLTVYCQRNTHQSLQLPNGDVCPVVMGSGIVSQPVVHSSTASLSEMDVKIAPETLEHLRPGRAVMYRFEERGEIWLLQSHSADPTVLQVQALDTGQCQYQQHHVQHIELAPTPMAGLQTIEVGGTMSIEMAGEELVNEVAQVGSAISEVGNNSSDIASAMITGDGHSDSRHSQTHYQLPSVVPGSHPSPVVEGVAPVINTMSTSVASMVHETGTSALQDHVSTMVQSVDSGPIQVGAEETTGIGNNHVKAAMGGPVTVNSVVMSVLQKKLTQADQTPIATSGARGVRRQDGPVHQCNECGASFNSMFHLRRHQQTHTGARPFACPICNLCFRHKTSLTVHIRRHTGEMPFHCPVCDKRFRDPANFKVHVRSHTDQKNYECKLCNKRFNSASTLYAHNKTHENVKPYTCVDCKKSFRFNTTLVRHIRTHTGEKPYSCDRCSLCFATASNLAAHRRRHDNADRAGKKGAQGKSPTPTHKCAECGQSFHTKPGLKVHIRQQHEQSRQHEASAVASPLESNQLAVTSAIANTTTVPGTVPTMTSPTTTATIAPVTTTIAPATVDGVSWEPEGENAIEGIVLQCSICSEVYFNEKQLTDHMVASHTNTRYNRRSWRVSDASWESSRSKPRTLVPNTYIAVREVAQERQQLQNVQESRHEFCRQQEIVGFFQGVEKSGGDDRAEFYTCDTCGKKFDSADVYKAHMRTHNISKGIRVVYTMRSVS